MRMITALFLVSISIHVCVAQVTITTYVDAAARAMCIGSNTTTMTKALDTCTNTTATTGEKHFCISGVPWKEEYSTFNCVPTSVTSLTRYESGRCSGAGVKVTCSGASTATYQLVLRGTIKTDTYGANSCTSNSLFSSSYAPIRNNCTKFTDFFSQSEHCDIQHNRTTFVKWDNGACTGNPTGLEYHYGFKCRTLGSTAEARSCTAHPNGDQILASPGHSVPWVSVGDVFYNSQCSGSPAWRSVGITSKPNSPMCTRISQTAWYLVSCQGIPENFTRTFYNDSSCTTATGFVQQLTIGGCNALGGALYMRMEFCNQTLFVHAPGHSTSAANRPFRFLDAQYIIFGAVICAFLLW